VWACALCTITFTLTCVAAQEAGYIVYADNHEGSYLREPKPTEVPMSVDAMSVALTSLLGLPPAIVTGEDLAAQVDNLLAPNPFSRPDAVLSLQVYGGEDFLSDSQNVDDCCCGHSRHVLPLQQAGGSMGNLDTALMSVASHANGPSLVHGDLDCDRIAEVCDHNCQEEALGALAGYLGGQYVRSGVPMQGKLLWDESSMMDLVNAPERELAVELACLVNAANGPWKMSPAPISEEPTTPPPRHLLTGKLDSLKTMHETYGKESTMYKDGSKLLARTIGMAKKAAHKAFGNKLVSQLALLGHSSQEDTPEGSHLLRRHLLQSSRDADQWLTLFMALSVGFALVVVTIVSICCMFSMEFKQDTILYGKGKTD